ncbi:MAG: MFS transporter, partial [Bacteroidales bacterium]|nr:MFS transporter [Bacteroidales bacterium]
DVFLISTAHMLHDVFSSFLAPLRPLLIEKFGLSLFESSLLDIFQRIPNLFNPIIGIVAEKAPARYFVIITPAVTAVSMSLLGVAPSYTMLAILLFVMGLSGAFFHVPSPVMIRKVSGERIGKGMSWYMAGGEIARTLGPLVITGAVSWWTLEGTWKLIPFGLVASFVLYLRLRKIRISGEFSHQKKQIGITAAWKKYYPFLLILFGLTLFRSMMKSSLTAFLPTYYYSEMGKSLLFSNSALTILQLAGVFGSLFSGTLSDRFGRKTILLVITLITPILLIAFTQANEIMAFPLLILLGFFIVAPMPVILATIQDYKSDNPIFLNGMYMMISFVTGSVAVMISGYMGDILGLKMTFVITAIVSLGSIPFILKLPNKE